MVRLNVPTNDTFEVLLEPRGKEEMEAYIRELQREKPHSAFE